MTVARETQDEAAEVMRCLGESLREPTFAIVLAFLLSGKRQGEEHDFPECEASGTER